MSAALKPITKRPIQPPALDNSPELLADFALWLPANLKALEAHWDLLGRHVPADVRIPDNFGMWTPTVFDRACMAAGINTRPSDEYGSAHYPRDWQDDAADDAGQPRFGEL